MKQCSVTQYLYQKKNVECMIVYGLLQRVDYKELLFWVSEYIHSGYHDTIWSILWTVYFDFYALHYPYVYTYISKKYTLYRSTHDATCILDVIKNLYYMKHSHHLFEFRLCMQHTHYIHQPVRGRKPKWVHAFDQPFHCLLVSIRKHIPDNIMLFYQQCKNHSLLYHTLIQFCQTHIPSQYTYIQTYERLFKSHSHPELLSHFTLLYLYVMCITKPTHITYKKRLFIKSSTQDLRVFTQYHTIQDIHKDCWNLLQVACVYKTSHLVNVFNHQLHTDIRHIDRIWHHWEYYAFHCPLWNKRFISHNAYPDDNTKSIVFKNDEVLEKFYDSYGLEPDEQNKETQDKIMFKYTHIPIQTLFTTIWNVTTDVLYDDFAYTYVDDDSCVMSHE